ncbi:MAG: hypothetical protein ACI9US_003081 [Gammaproteobacteria bacterium]|jgi:hypothetical protein
MQVQIQFQCRAKALDQCHRTRMSLRYLEACLVDQVGPRRYVQIVRLTMANTLPRKREQNLRVKPKVNAASRRQCNDIVSPPRIVQLTKLLNHFACWNHPKQTSDVMVGVVINTAWYATRHTNQIPFPGMTMLAIKI